MATYNSTHVVFDTDQCGNEILPDLPVRVGDKITVEFEVLNVVKAPSVHVENRVDTCYTVKVPDSVKTISIPAEMVVDHKPASHAVNIYNAIGKLIEGYTRNSVFDSESPLGGVALVVSDIVYQAIKPSITLQNGNPYYTVNRRDYEYATALPIVVNNADKNFKWSLVRCLDQG